MSVHLNPVTAAKLQAFGKRRFRLILIRGLCAGLLALLAAMTLIAVIDWLFLLPDQLRWALSAAGYLAVGVVVYATCVRLIARVPSSAKLARLLESVQPELREDLVSAVELSDENAVSRAWDSEVFRQLLQDDVAQRMEKIEVDRLLPQKLIAGWEWTTGAALVLVLALLCIPGLRFDTLMYRALVPVANVGRVSRTHVQVLAPNPTNPTVPFNDPVMVVVQLSGADADDVTLEAFRDGAPMESVRMTASADRQFQSTLHVGRENIEYRIKAGDAITEKYMINAQPRPSVTAFHKTFTYPEYAKLAPKNVTEKAGDLIALEGTKVDLVLETDQGIESAQLVLKQGAEPNTVLMTPDKDGRLHALVDLNQSGTYRVELTAAGTKFTNKFSPDYELRAEPDLVPRVEITEPTQSVLAPPDEVIDLRGKASDDLMLASVVQSVRVNDGPWVDTPLLAAPAKEANLSRVWDLYDLGLQPGDRVTTRLIATDLKGLESRSKTLQVVVSSKEFDPRRLQQLSIKRRAFDAMQELARTTVETRRYIAKAEELTRSNPLGDAHRLQAMIEATDAVSRLEESAENTATILKSAIHDVDGGRDAHDLVLAARTTVEARASSLPQVKADMRAANTATDQAQAAALMKSALEAMNRVGWNTQTGRDMYGRIFGADQSAVIAAHLVDLHAHQQRIAEQTASGDQKSEATWRRLARRQGAAAAQVQIVETLAQDLVDRNVAPAADRAKEILKKLTERRTHMQQAIDGETDNRLLGPSNDLKQHIEWATNDALAMYRDQANNAIEARKQLTSHVGRAYRPVYEAYVAAMKFNEATAKVDKLKQDNAPADQIAKAKEELDTASRAAARTWTVASTLLQQRADMEEARRDSDSTFVNDLSRASTAVDALVARGLINPLGDHADATAKLNELQLALYVIESGRDLGELAGGLNGQAARERFKAPPADARTNMPQDWRWDAFRFEDTPQWMERAKLPAQSYEDLRKVAVCEQARKVERETNDRPNGINQSVHGVPDELAYLAREVERIRRMIAPQVAEARARLAELTPKLSEQLAEAAKAAKEAQKQAEELAEQAKAQNNQAQTRAEAKEQLAAQEDLSRQIEQALDALRRDANEQDVFSQEGRERMRDDDAAVALVGEKPQQAENALEKAATSAQAQQQAQALEQAAQQQSELAKTLDQLAKHFENLEAGQPEPTRAALRQAEDQAGVKPQLDAQFNRLEQLANLQQQSPQQLLQQLEAELKKNPTMQRELSQIARDTLQNAAEQLAQAAQTEQAIAQNFNQAAQQEEQAVKASAQQLADIGRKAAELAQKDVPQAAQTAQAAGAKEANQPLDNAKNELGDAADKANAAANAANSNQVPPDELAKQAKAVADPLTQAAEQLQAAAQAAADVAQGKGLTQEQAQADAQSAGQAAQQAQNAAQAAQQAAKSAQQAAEKAPFSPQAKQAANQAQQAAQAAQQHANQAQQAAQQAANANDRAEVRQASAQAAQQTQAAAQDAQNAANAAQQAAQAAQQALDQQPANAQQAAKNAQQQATEAQQAAGQAKEAARQAATSPTTPNAQAAAKQAANAAQQAQEAAQAAQNAAQFAPDSQPAQGAAEAAAQAAQQAAQNAQQAAQAAQQAADAGGDQAAAQRAEKQAADAAAQAAQAAEQAGNAAQQAAQASESAQPSAAAQQAAKQAGEAAQQAGQAAQKAQQSAQAAAAPQQQAQAAQQQANQAAQAAQQLAQQAQAIADNLAKQMAQPADALAQAAGQQPQVGQQVGDAGQEVARAARHEARLNNQQAAEQLGQIAQGTEQVADQAVPQAGQQLAQANSAQQGQQAAQGAQQAIQQQANQLAQALQRGQQPQGQQGQQAGEQAGQQAGEPAGQQAGEASGQPAGEPAGQQAGEASGQPAGDPAGQQAGQPAGQQAGQPSGQQAGQPSGQQAGQPGGQQAGEQAGQPGGQPAGDNAPLTPEASRQLARALDQLDQQLFGQPQGAQPGDAGQLASAQPGQGEAAQPGQTPGQGQEPGQGSEQGQPGSAQGQPGQPGSEPGGQPGSEPGQPGSEPGQPGQPGQGSPAQASAAAAAQAQAAAMAAARSNSQTPGQQPIGQGMTTLSQGAAIVGGDTPYAALPEIALRAKAAEWGKLPPKLAKDLVEGSRENVAAEYRQAVEAYFRVIAERAKEQGKR